MPETTLTAKSVRIAPDEAKWLSAAAAKGGVTQNDLLRLALTRLRKDLGAANRIKPDAVVAVAKASRYKLTPSRAAANTTPSARQPTSKTSANGKPAPSKVTGRGRSVRTRTA
jgi:hypothetical protein